jgi:biopolymer transport protein ExbD
MAYSPSKRSSQVIEPLELNLFPMLNLMTNIIPLLLTTAIVAKVGMVELNLPQAVGGPIAENIIPKEVQPSLDLTVTITDNGFYISSSRAVLSGSSGSGPTIAKLADGRYDYNQLTQRLYEIKRKIIGGPNDTKRIIMQAEANIEYQIFISTMDASRSILIEDKLYELFPEVAVSVGIL